MDRWYGAATGGNGRLIAENWSHFLSASVCRTALADNLWGNNGNHYNPIIDRLNQAKKSFYFMLQGEGLLVNTRIQSSLLFPLGMVQSGSPYIY